MKTPNQTCPICGRPEAEAVRPFCGARCAQIDLGRWLTESYRVPVSEEDDPDADDADTVAPPRRDGAHQAG